jgi:hypothetical protein
MDKTLTIDPELDRIARNLGEVVDHFLSVPFCVSGGPSVFAEKPLIGHLYRAARALTNDLPLSYSAARALLERVPRGGRVIIGTGFTVPPYLRPEGDGPIGAPFLARALALTREAHTIVVTEPANVAPIETVMRASGLQLASLEEALEVPHKTTVISIPVTDDAGSRAHARKLLDRLAPDAIVTIEKLSRNEKGRYYNGMVVDLTDVVAKLDFVMEEARARNILTIGMGDGGNEIGMGNILQTVKEHVPNGATVGAATGADFLVVTGSASWGSYGVEACIAALAGKPHALHNEEMERRMLDASAMAGIVDPLTGLAEGWLDGVPPQVNYAIVRILNYLFDVRMRPWGIDLYRAWGARKAESDALLARYAPALTKGGSELP